MSSTSSFVCNACPCVRLRCLIYDQAFAYKSSVNEHWADRSPKLRLGSNQLIAFFIVIVRCGNARCRSASTQGQYQPFASTVIQIMKPNLDWNSNPRCRQSWNRQFDAQTQSPNSNAHRFNKTGFVFIQFSISNCDCFIFQATDDDAIDTQQSNDRFRVTIRSLVARFDGSVCGCERLIDICGCVPLLISMLKCCTCIAMNVNRYHPMKTKTMSLSSLS